MLIRLLLAIATILTTSLLLTSVTAMPAEAAKTATVVRWVDGDTVRTSRGTVRLIGIDTPEAGDCGAKKAKQIARKLAPNGTRITLRNPRSVQNRDSYDRKLRYVGSSVDIGLRQIREGARARYDSRTGYDRHPRQGKYVKADKRSPNYKCGRTPQDKSSYSPIPGTWDCPAKAPIKGNQGSPEWIYHLPRNAYYEATNPEECFASEAAARAAGYRAAKV